MQRSNERVGAVVLVVVLLQLLAISATQSAQAQTLSVLYSFTGGADGSQPVASLVQDSAGNLYGTTQLGGSFANGVVFKVTATDSEAVLHSFTGKTDGGQPVAPLLRDGADNLYGTTQFGGNAQAGVVFKLVP